MSKTLRYAVTALLAGLTLLLGAPAASAHGGAIELEVVGNGADNVNVLVTWKKDHHPVTATVIATLTAKSADGRTFGPVTLRSSPEGQNLYNAAEPLPSGEWRVTVKATEPSKARKTVTVTAKDAAVVAEQAAAAASQDGAAAPAQDGAAPGRNDATAPREDGAAAAGAAQEDGTPIGTLLIVGVATLAVAAGVVTWMRLGRRGGPV
ncbi:hypothetical protein ABGB17_34815 [Sphaerisporangium sp. B11E5]|uniref:hypothetical protein n=1 Tax=Sphaerisporangium sp. B11E5 TaxID=3153563 RepID=UPI00325F3A9F